MEYGIECQAIGERVWHPLAESFSTEQEAQDAIPTVIARGGKWVRRVYRVREKQATEPTHPELARLVERLRAEDALFAFWSENDAEAVLLLDDGRAVVAVPGAPVWEGLRGDRPVGAIVSEIRERVRVEKEQADRVQWEKEQKERVDRERADQERVIRERADRERANRVQWEKEQRERVGREHADRERAEQERVDRERADRERWEKEQQERAERDRAKRSEWEKEQRDQAQRDRARRERAERAALDPAVDDRAQRHRAEQAPSPIAATPQRVEWAPPYAATAAAVALPARVTPAVSPPMNAPVVPIAQMAPLPMVAPSAPTQREVPPQPVRVAPVTPPMAPPGPPPTREVAAPPARVAPVASPLKVAPVTPPPKVAPVVPSPSVVPAAPMVAARIGPPVLVTAAPSTAARGVGALGDVPNLPRPRSGATSDLGALAKLLRCGAWREGMRSCDIVASESPDELPAGAHRALQELAGVARPTARQLGNALKRVVDKRLEGIAAKLTRKVDGHGFAVWQVVPDSSEPNGAPQRPTNAGLVRNALIGMGYRHAEAECAVAALGARLDTEPLPELVREALGVLARRTAHGLHAKGR